MSLPAFVTTERKLIGNGMLRLIERLSIGGWSDFKTEILAILLLCNVR